MRFASAVLLLVFSTVFAFQARAQAGPGCGPSSVEFDVKTTREHPAPVPQAGEALVFFIQDDFSFQGGPRPTTRFGIDGDWVGATHANSYFYVPVRPGEHNVCASWEPLATIGLSIFQPHRSEAAAHFTAQAGHDYYFRAKDILIRGAQNALLSGPEVKLESVDSDEAQVLMNSFSFSSSHPKK